MLGIWESILDPWELFCIDFRPLGFDFRSLELIFSLLTLIFCSDSPFFWASEFNFFGLCELMLGMRESIEGFYDRI